MLKKSVYVRSVLLLLVSISLLASCKHQFKDEKSMDRIQLLDKVDEKKVDVLIDGKLFTSYIYPNSIKKPVLYPLITPMGTTITRKFPLEPSVGERVDHPHHVGLWFNHGDVNGLDFWNNSDAVDPKKRRNYGSIVHQSIEKLKAEGNSGELQVVMDWMTPDGKLLLKERTMFVFSLISESYAIDRITTLTAQDQRVDFKDSKEGLLGIRVRRELEHPSDKPIIVTDSKGIPLEKPIVDNDGVNGNYINAEGLEGGDCWGKRSEWVNLRSKIGDENISLVILDHKSNVGYPTYWHARTYGLFAANPLGQKKFSKEKDELNFKLESGESVTFRHRVLIASQELGESSIDSMFESFSDN